MKLPILDNRGSQDILNDVKSLAKSYTPEWDFSEDNPDFGVAISQIYSDMMMQTINSYNRTPYNHFLTFLNLLNAKLLPPDFAQGFITIEVQEGIDGVYIEKGSLVYADANNEEGRVFYQLSQSVYADSVQIQEVLCTDGSTDRVVSVSTPENFRAFDTTTETNLQKHIIYFRNDIIFACGEHSDITLCFINKISQAAQNSLIEIFSVARFEYYADECWKEIKQVNFYGGNTVRLIFDDCTHEFELLDETGLYIRCVFDIIPEQQLTLTDILCFSQGKKIVPTALSAGDSDLTKNDFFPFLESYNVHDCFYIGCDEAFSKTNAEVSLNFEMDYVKSQSDIQWTPPPITYKSIMKSSDFDVNEPQEISIESVVWEYFNGNGWVRLFNNNECNDFFTNSEEKILTFTVPPDLEISSNSGFTGKFIRARIIRLKNPYSYGGSYITPFVKQLTIEYCYKDFQPHISHITVDSNLVKRKIFLADAGIKPIIQNELLPEPAMYFMLSKAISNGPIRILFDIEKNTVLQRPGIRWEYYALGKDGTGCWENLDVSDKTNGFASGAIVTVMGKKDFCRGMILGREGYFLRVVDIDSKYRKMPLTRLPLMNGIYFNTVGIIQKTAMSTEYFFVEPGEVGKNCQLSAGNVCDISVRVDEKGLLTSNEENFLLNTEAAQPEYDSTGQLNKLWVEWKQTDNLSNHTYDERVFELEPVEGKVRFGDGIRGKIPANKRYESIMVEYSVTDGTYGNISADAILGFANAIPYITNVINRRPVVGGVDMENVEQASERMATKLSSLDRLVTLEDYERALSAYERRVRSVKCVPHIDRFGKKKMGCISVAVLPNDYMGGTEQFDVIAKNLNSFITERSGLFANKKDMLSIFEVSYVEMTVTLTVIMSDYNYYHQIYQDVNAQLEKFLNPITGNFDGKGFDIGSIPNAQSIHNCIMRVKNIKMIKKIDIFTSIITREGKKEIDFAQASQNIFAVPVFGEVEINPIIE